MKRLCKVPPRRYATDRHSRRSGCPARLTQVCHAHGRAPRDPSAARGRRAAPHRDLLVTTTTTTVGCLRRVHPWRTLTSPPRPRIAGALHPCRCVSGRPCFHAHVGRAPTLGSARRRRRLYWRWESQAKRACHAPPGQLWGWDLRGHDDSPEVGAAAGFWVPWRWDQVRPRPRQQRARRRRSWARPATARHQGLAASTLRRALTRPGSRLRSHCGACTGAAHPRAPHASLPSRRDRSRQYHRERSGTGCD